MKKIIIALVALSCQTALGQGQAKQQTPEAEYLKSMHQNITSDKLFEYVKHLSDSTIYQGRLAGSEGMARAAKWAQNYFKEWGLDVINGAPEYMQEYPHPCVEVGYGSGMKILIPVASQTKGEAIYVEKTYPWADGWFAGGTSGNGEITADIIYAGYGVTAPELGYDDYKGIDVKGKIVLIEGETPNTSRTKDSLLMWYPYTLHQSKVANAVAHGAAGMLYKWVPGPNNGYDPNFIYSYVTDMVVNDIFAGTGKTYKETIKNIRTTKKPNSFATGKRATIKMNTTYNPKATGKNIVGVVRGSDPVLADEYVIVSGHLDHLGMIPYHIAGANDNNSATAVLMGVAEAMAKSTVKPKRSVIFINIDGEEAGLDGSAHFANSLLVPKEKVKAVLNLEQVGVGENIHVSYGVETPYLEGYFQKANDQYVHRRVTFSGNNHITRPRTDGAVFMKAGYPTVDIGTNGGRSYYHHPKDDWNTMNPEILQDVAKLVYFTAIEIANQ